MKEGKATYTTREEAHGKGMFFYTRCCGNRMYSVRNDPMLYHGAYCPKCYWEGKNIILYMTDTEEAKDIL